MTVKLIKTFNQKVIKIKKETLLNTFQKKINILKNLEKFILMK